MSGPLLGLPGAVAALYNLNLKVYKAIGRRTMSDQLVQTTRYSITYDWNADKLCTGINNIVKEVILP